MLGDDTSMELSKLKSNMSVKIIKLIEFIASFWN